MLKDGPVPRSSAWMLGSTAWRCLVKLDLDDLIGRELDRALVSALVGSLDRA